jgi:hypothetical protein
MSLADIRKREHLPFQHVRLNFPGANRMKNPSADATLAALSGTPRASARTFSF